MANPTPPVSFLRACLDYDPETGAFRWRARPESHFNDPRVFVRWNRHRAGSVAFSPVENRRYLRSTVTYNGVEIELLAHRVAWALVTGEHPKAQIDHRNCDTFDTRFTNLREATQTENNRNRRPNVRKLSPLKGVSSCRGRRQWRATVQVDGKPIYLGRFYAAEDAHAAYAAAAIKHFGEFARTA